MEVEWVSVKVKVHSDLFLITLPPNLYRALNELRRYIRQDRGLRDFAVFWNQEFLGQLSQSETRIICDGDEFFIQPVIGGG